MPGTENTSGSMKSQNVATTIASGFVSKFSSNKTMIDLEYGSKWLTFIVAAVSLLGTFYNGSYLISTTPPTFGDVGYLIFGALVGVLCSVIAKFGNKTMRGISGGYIVGSLFGLILYVFYSLFTTAILSLVGLCFMALKPFFMIYLFMHICDECIKTT